MRLEVRLRWGCEVHYWIIAILMVVIGYGLLMHGGSRILAWVGIILIIASPKVFITPLQHPGRPSDVKDKEEPATSKKEDHL